MKVEEYARMRSKIDALRQQKARAEGALEQAMKKLSEELGAPAAEAERRIAELEERTKQSRRRIEKKLDAFAKRWGEKFDEE